MLTGLYSRAIHTERVGCWVLHGVSSLNTNQPQARADSAHYCGAVEALEPSMLDIIAFCLHVPSDLANVSWPSLQILVS